VDRIAVTASDSRSYYRSTAKVVVTGYPVRSELAQWTPEDGRHMLGLSSDLPILLVTGGSRGARSINRAVTDNLPALLEMAQVVHLCGTLDWPEIESMAARMSSDLSGRYHPMPYLHEMGAALACADLVVSRAGASVLGEYPFFGLPAILVPYPYAWRYQRVNAGVLARHRAALVLEDQLLKNDLLPLITDLLRNPAKLQAMRSAMRGLRQPDAAAEIALELAHLAEPRSSDG
jgi:UDP-N-acetylglucosamine--N-acetylmuramyl-(pentapeptide) pyrophosphoryl-undecaprenol N-acetylglucosamine transferase